MPLAKLARVGYSGVICSVVSCMSTGEQHERISAPHALLQRVEQRIGLHPQAVNVFQQLGSFVVVAAPAFLAELLTQPEVHAAMANRQPDDPTTPGRSAGAEGDE